MRKLFCDRCGNEMNTTYKQIGIGRTMLVNPLDLCKKCSDAFDHFMGIDNAGYEQLDSEKGGETE